MQVDHALLGRRLTQHIQIAERRTRTRPHLEAQRTRERVGIDVNRLGQMHRQAFDRRFQQQRIRRVAKRLQRQTGHQKRRQLGPIQRNQRQIFGKRLLQVVRLATAIIGHRYTQPAQVLNVAGNRAPGHLEVSGRPRGGKRTTTAQPLQQSLQPQDLRPSQRMIACRAP